MFCGDKVANENAKLLSIFFYQYLVMEMPKIMMRKECIEDKQPLADLSSTWALLFASKISASRNQLQ